MKWINSASINSCLECAKHSFYVDGISWCLASTKSEWLEDIEARQILSHPVKPGTTSLIPSASLTWTELETKAMDLEYMQQPAPYIPTTFHPMINGPLTCQ